MTSMALDAQALKKIIRLSLNIPTQPLGCDECLAYIDQYAETTLAGKKIPEMMQLIEEHLRDCPECEEELQALLVALRALGTAE
jgi:hypothetical protein